MRHKAQVSHFGRRTGGRTALIRSLVFALVRDGRIKTTLPKAKELKRHAERAVTMAKGETLNARRMLMAKYPNTDTVHALMDVIAPRFKTRLGGYTRIIKVGTRSGDRAEMAYIEWLDYVRPQSETDAAADGASGKAAGKASSKTKVKKAKSAKVSKSGNETPSVPPKKAAPAKKSVKSV
jgi:large subunit ribosomal protein L17